MGFQTERESELGGLKKKIRIRVIEINLASFNWDRNLKQYREELSGKSMEIC